MNDLSPAVQEMLTPFLIPPVHEGSWYYIRNPVEQAKGAPANMTRRRALADENVADTIPPNLRFIDTANGKARVWWNPEVPGLSTEASTVANELDRWIWTRLTTVMGREPLRDDNISLEYNGGDGRLDVYLVESLGRGGFGMTVGFRPRVGAGCAGQTHIYLLAGQSRRRLLASAAHELMHAIVRSINLKTCQGEYSWLDEATAIWAEQYAYSGENTEQDDGIPEEYLFNPFQSLDDTRHERGSYLFPFYLEQKKSIRS
jgi:hypothetical protein